MNIVDLGVMPYSEALTVQLECHERVRQGEEDTLFLVEHPPVITFGRHGGENLLLGRAELAARGVEIVKTDRGGNITCHFPGQLVAYPVFRVGKRTNGLHGFVRTLEEIVIRSAAAFGVEAARWEGRPGVWIGNRKLCSLGMCVRHWVSFHGFALNVGNDLSLFSAITLCGYLLGQLNGGKLKKILFCGTGALLSPTSTQQGLPIPGVCHAVCIAGGT